MSEVSIIQMFTALNNVSVYRVKEGVSNSNVQFKDTLYLIKIDFVYNDCYALILEFRYRCCCYCQMTVLYVFVICSALSRNFLNEKIATSIGQVWQYPWKNWFGWKGVKTAWYVIYYRLFVFMLRIYAIKGLWFIFTGS